MKQKHTKMSSFISKDFERLRSNIKNKTNTKGTLYFLFEIGIGHEDDHAEEFIKIHEI